MNKLQRMIAFAERYNLAWDDPDFDRIYEYLISAGHEQASRVAAMQSEGHKLGCPSLYDREYAEAYEHYHKKGTAKAAEKGLVAGYAEDYADDYAAKYAHADAYDYTKNQVTSICHMLADGLPETAIYRYCSIPKTEIDAVIAQFNEGHSLERLSIIRNMLSHNIDKEIVYRCIDAPRSEIDALIAKVQSEN